MSQVGLVWKYFKTKNFLETFSTEEIIVWIRGTWPKMWFGVVTESVELLNQTTNSWTIVYLNRMATIAEARKANHKETDLKSRMIKVMKVKVLFYQIMNSRHNYDRSAGNDLVG